MMKKNLTVSLLALLTLYFSLGFIQEARSIRYDVLSNLLLGSAPNFMASLLLPLCASSIRGKSNLYQISLAMSLGLIIYEFMQIYIDERNFDTFDLIFTFLGLLASFVLIKIIFPREKFSEIFLMK